MRDKIDGGFISGRIVLYDGDVVKVGERVLYDGVVVMVIVCWQ